MPGYPGSILRVEYPADRPVAVLTLDAPPLNIVTIPTREHFAATFREIEHNDRVRVVIIRSAGEHFTSGGDIQGFLDATPKYPSNTAAIAAASDSGPKTGIE